MASPLPARMVRFCLGAAIAIAGCGRRPTIEEPPPGFGRGPDAIERLCPEPATDVWDAVIDTLKDNGFEIAHEDHDALGGEMAAERNGGRIIVRVRQVDQHQSSLAVRVEPPDPRVTLQLQETFARALGRGEARSGLFGGASEEQVVELPLDPAIRAAEATMKTLRIGVIDRRRGRGVAELDGRRIDSVPVRIRLESSDGRTTEATFVAGTTKSDDVRALAKRMRREFELRARDLTP